MKKFLFLIIFLACIINGYSQFKSATFNNSAIMYFCEKYDDKAGAINVDTRFTTGKITIVIWSGLSLGLTDVTIQFDKLNKKTNKFDFYLQAAFTLNPKGNTFYFQRDDIYVGDVGIYRAYLLNDRRQVIANALLEIVE